MMMVDVGLNDQVRIDCHAVVTHFVTKPQIIKFRINVKDQHEMAHNYDLK